MDNHRIQATEQEKGWVEDLNACREGGGSFGNLTRLELAFARRVHARAEAGVGQEIASLALNLEQARQYVATERNRAAVEELATRKREAMLTEIAEAVGTTFNPHPTLVERVKAGVVERERAAFVAGAMFACRFDSYGKDASAEAARRYAPTPAVREVVLDSKYGKVAIAFDAKMRGGVWCDDRDNIYGDLIALLYLHRIEPTPEQYAALLALRPTEEDGQ